MSNIKSAISVHIIFPLAAQETLLGNFKEIEPEHFFNGILKFAEYEDGELKKLVREVPKALSQIMKERDSLRTYLECCNIKVPSVSTDIRRKLRLEMGEGNFSGKRDKIHRSAATCELFRHVEDNAEKRGLTEWSLHELVELLLRRPSPSVKKIMTEYEIEVKSFKQLLAGPVEKYLNIKVSPSPDRPAIKEKPPVEMEEKIDIRKEAIFPVIIEALKKKEKSILLIQHGKITPSEIIKTLEEYFKYETEDCLLKDRIIMKIEKSDYSLSATELEIKLENIFRDSKLKGNMFFFINSFHDFIMRKEFYSRLKEKLKEKHIICMAGTDSYNYNKYIQPDSEWKKYFRPLWIHNRVTIPERL
ncbi:MAG: hypothetical protein ABRQ37_01795 [Candidatus Eremiobacterota bacterium]